MFKKLVICVAIVLLSNVDFAVGQEGRDAASRMATIRNAQRQRNAAQARSRARQRTQQRARQQHRTHRSKKANTTVVRPGKRNSVKRFHNSNSGSKGTGSWVARSKSSATNSYRKLSKFTKTHVRRMKAINRLSRMKSQYRYAKRAAQREGLNSSKQLSNTFRQLRRRDAVNKWNMIGKIFSSGRFFKTKSWKTSQQTRNPK